MRLLRLTVLEWELLERLENCEFVVLERPPDDGIFSIAFTWRGGHPKDYGGLRSKQHSGNKNLQVWTGDKRARLVTSKTADLLCKSADFQSFSRITKHTSEDPSVD